MVRDRCRRRAAMASDAAGAVSSSRVVARQDGAGALEIGRSIDTERNRVNERGVDAHARLERAQLLQPLALLERRRRQGDEACQRRAPIGVNADMMVMRSVARRHGQAAEVERAADRGRAPSSDRRTRPPPSPRWDCRARHRIVMRVTTVPMSTAGSASGASAARDGRRVDGRQVALHVDHGIVPALADRPPAAPRRCGRNRRDAPAGSAWPCRRRPRTASAISGSAQATRTGPISASAARRQTWTIIGWPRDIGQRLVAAAASRPGARDDRRSGSQQAGAKGRHRPLWWGRKSLDFNPRQQRWHRQIDLSNQRVAT